MNYDEYHSLRDDQQNLFGYGLQRRFSKIRETIKPILCQNAKPIHLVDFGCADGFMLRQLLADFDTSIGQATGFDLFESGIPEDANRISFSAVNLFHDYPYPVDDNSVDLCIASAFFKHHPQPTAFLAETARILRSGGKILLTDPCSLVVRIGLAVGYFDRNWMPNRWHRAGLQKLLTSSQVLADLRLVDYQRYWLAPNKKLFDLGVENWIPPALRNDLGLHQLAVIERR